MVNRLRKHYDTDKSKQYYITGAPQCPFPDAMMGPALDEVAFDAVFVQFYNNYCATTSSNFNFNTWDNWAKKTSVNKNVKILLGLPGSVAAAGSGYVPFGQLQPIVQNLQSTYSSFGGVMLWGKFIYWSPCLNFFLYTNTFIGLLDASASYVNTDVSPSYQVAVANLVHGGKPPVTTVTKTTSTTTTTKSASTTPGVSTSTGKPVTTTTTTTTTTTAPTSVPTAPATCVTNNSACSIEGQLTCAGNSFATCNHGKWGLRECPSGLTCFSTADGGSVYCATGSGNTSCPAKSATTVGLGKPAVAKPGPSIKPYKDGKVTAQFSVTHSDSRSFKALINARRLDKKSFGKTVTVQFKVASNIKITRVKNGKVTQNGNHVKVQFKNGGKKTMVAIIGIEGKIKSGVFVAPTASTMKIFA